jgi:serine protease AprX
MREFGTVGVKRRLGSVLVTAVVACIGATGVYAPSSDGNQNIVVLVSQVHPSDASVGRTVERLGGTVLRKFPIIDGFAARLPARAVGALASSPSVRWVTPNQSLELQGAYGQDSDVASAVYTDVVRATKTWSAGYNGTGVNVALVDTGVNTDGDLASRVVHAEDFTSEQNNADSYGHGTFVAGLIAGKDGQSPGLVKGLLGGLLNGGDRSIKGVAPGSKIVSVKIAGRDGSTDVTRVLAALEWIVDFRDVYGIRVVNLSIGFTSNQSYGIDPLDFAVERVWNDGIVVVAAAGNGGNEPGTITTPGNDAKVITVGASDDGTTTSTSDDTLASFSSSGPTADGLAKPEVLAPGRSVVSSRSPGSTIDTTYRTSAIDATHAKGSGTSFSTAIASGAAALVISRTWKLTPDQVKQRLISSSRALTGGATPATGAGTIDAYAATMSNDLTAANRNVTPANGGGSLQATRGPTCLRDPAGACMTDIDADAALGFDSAEYYGPDWAGSHWVGSQWVGSSWTGSQWVGSQWVGSQWVGSNDASKSWSWSQWTGSQWVGSQWSGSQWTGSQWTGSQWTGSQWVGSQWAADVWSGGPWLIAP